MIKRITKIFLWIAVSAAGLLVLLSVLVYLPPVQNFAKNKASQYVAGSMGMDLEIGRFALRFPLDLSVERVSLAAGGDTLAAFERLDVGVKLLPLFSGRVEVERAGLEGAAVNYVDTLTGMRLRGRLGGLSLHGANVSLSSGSVGVERLYIGDTRIDMVAGMAVEEPDDTTSSAPWLISAGRIELSDVGFGMTGRDPAMELDTHIGSGRIETARVDLGRQDVSLERLLIAGGRYRFQTDTVSVAAAGPAEADSLPPSLPWTIMAGSVEFADNALDYGSLYGEPAEGFDPSHISLTSVNLRIDSVYNRSSDVSAAIRSLSARERSGIEVSSASGRFRMDSAGIRLGGFELRTPGSHIGIDATAGVGILAADSRSEVGLKLDVRVAPDDIFVFYPADKALRETLAGRRVDIGGTVGGTLGDLNIGRLSAGITGMLDMDITGRVRSVTSPEDLSGDLDVTADLRDMESLEGFIADTALRRRLGLPQRLTIDARLSAGKGRYSVEKLAVEADSGRLDVRGYFDAVAGSYGADVSAAGFPLHSFLPADSLGLLDMSLRAEGAGIDPLSGRAAADVSLDVARFDFRGVDLGGLTFKGRLDSAAVRAWLAVDNEALDIDLGVDGSIGDRLYGARLHTGIRKIDLTRLGFLEQPFAFSGALAADAMMRTDTTAYKVEFALDSASLTMGRLKLRPDRTTVSAAADVAGITAAVRSGDLRLDLSTDAGVDSLSSVLAAVGEIVTRQIDERRLDMAAVQRSMPDVKIEAYLGKKNMLHTLLEERGTDFRSATLRAVASRTRPLSAMFRIEGLSTGGLVLDTLNVGVRRDSDSLAYFMRLANRPGNIDQMAMILVHGKIAGSSASMGFLQHDRERRTGFRFGLEAELSDSAVMARFYPLNPIFGYRNWTVNGDNYLRYGFDNTISADLRLEGDGQHFRVVSGADSALRLDIAGIDIGELLGLLPSPPAVGGVFAADLNMRYAGGIPAVEGRASVKELSYDEKRVGDLDLDLTFGTDSLRVARFGGGLAIDGKRVLSARGALASPDGGAMNVAVEIPCLPLTAAGAFLPEETVRLAGELNGRITVAGAGDRLDIDGDVGFSGGRVEVPMIGTSFGITDNRISVADNVLTMDGFGLTAPNGRTLALGGRVDMRDMSRISTDVRLSASDFRAVNSTWTGGSQVYGRADLDADVRVRGPLDALSVRGGVKLLRTTDVVYTMRDSPLAVEDAKQDIVSFISFADTATLIALAERDSTRTVRRSFGLDMLVNVNIDEGVKATVNLSEEGNDRIELIGGGELSYSMNTEGDTRFAGRYELSGGTVVYNPPVISQKNFSIGTDSYVEWKGDMLDPAFNIKATESLRTTVKMEDGSSNNVDFNIIILIRNTLRDMDITFDLAAPSDLTIQNQLSSLTAEQRSQQAMGLLIYNTYTGPGATAKVDSNNPLNSFIEKELNQWARSSLKNVDVSFGINTVDDTATGGGQHTDYSYKVSKSLFNDRVKVSIGGSIDTDASTNQNLQENLVDDISLEYRVTSRDNMFLKLYRYNTQESVLEGEVVETGGGFLVRKKVNKLRDLFRPIKGDRRKERLQRRESRRAADEEAAGGTDDAAAAVPAVAEPEKQERR